MAQDKFSFGELTLRAIVLGVVLSMILAAANAYLGLFAGMTVSASIPAAVLSMGIFRLIRKATILENNVVQTAASSGEAVAAGAIFTLPALMILGFWKQMDYIQVTLLCGLGGLLGVLFTIPLRRSLIIEQKLQYPEGVATAEVLLAGQEGGEGLSRIIKAGIAGAAYKISGLGFGLWPEELEKACRLGSGILYGGINLSPALLSVGFIVGLNIAALIFIGGALNWFIAIPICSILGLDSGGDALEAASMLWKTKTRYIGVGAMVIGGLWAILQMRQSLLSGITSGLRAYRQTDIRTEEVPPTEKDIPMKWVLLMIVASVVPLFILYQLFIGKIAVSITMAICMIVTAFVFSAVTGYMAGLVGSSNNPVSGVTIATVLLSSALLAALMGRSAPDGPAAAIIIGGVVCCAAAIAGDNMQDLKTGYLVGATAWRQQIAQILGTLAGAVVIGPTMMLLNNAYGFAGAENAGKNALAAPQANLMASVAKGVFAGDLPWDFIFIGMGAAAVIILADLRLKAAGSSFRMPVLAVAIGIYLPMKLSMAIFIGGLIHYAAGKIIGAGAAEFKKKGFLTASGLITGEALIGILMAIPFALPATKNLLPLMKTAPVWGPPLGIAAFAAICRMLLAPEKKK